MRYWVKYFIFIGFVFLSIQSEADTTHTCDAIEIIDLGAAYNNYNNLLCSGIEQMKEERFEDAISSFKAALSIRFLDIPNFELLSRLAMAYFRARDIENAKYYLSATELSLSILIGTLKCVEVEVEDFGANHIITDRYGVRLYGDVVEEIVNRMCGAAYDYFYPQRSFSITLSNAKLITRYYAVKRLIESEEQSPE